MNDKWLRRVGVWLFFLFISTFACAQSADVATPVTADEIYTQSEQAYAIGQFDEAASLLKNNLRMFRGSMKVSALRLLALCSINQDEWKEAENYTSLLLAEDPFYSTAREENKRFVDMIEGMKEGAATITSASQFIEKLEESPVATTLITEDMIRMSGAKNLAELLVLYVPGISIIESQDLNVAMHGAYSRFQEKILVMLNGQRLNSRVTNSESLDYRTSLDKVKQIEVLRGPASSLYGNVALTAVVNIVTKQGREVDGVELKGGYGSNNTFQGSLLFGKRYMNLDFMAWASIFASDGEKITEKVGEKGRTTAPQGLGYVYSNRYNDLPSFDIGMNARYNNFSFMLSYQRSKKVMPYANTSIIYNYSMYDYDNYPKIDGSKPGFTNETTRLEFSYDNNWNNLSLQVKVFADNEKSSIYSVCGDSLTGIFRNFYAGLVQMAGGEESKKLIPDTVTYAYRNQQWNSYTLGANVQLGYSYTIGKHEGTILGGLQYEHFLMIDTRCTIGCSNLAPIVPVNSNSVLGTGNEYTVSAYLQFKQRFLKNFIFNGGIRYDRKMQVGNVTVYDWSPRLAVIWHPLQDLIVKACYSHSFVDAPYIYRADKVRSANFHKLVPEQVDGLQLGADFKCPKIGMTLSCNVFHNYFKDLIVHRLSNVFNNGKYQVAGVEGILSFLLQRHTVRLNLTYQHVLQNEVPLDAPQPEVWDVTSYSDLPDFAAKLLYNVKAFDKKKIGTLDLHANLSFTGGSQCNVLHVKDVGESNVSFSSEKVDVSRRFVVDAGFDYSWRCLTLAFNAYNLFNNRRYLSGVVIPRLVPQQGRNFMLTLKVRLK